jgi:hypothetical protein
MTPNKDIFAQWVNQNKLRAKLQMEVQQKTEVLQQLADTVNTPRQTAINPLYKDLYARLLVLLPRKADEDVEEKRKWLSDLELDNQKRQQQLDRLKLLDKVIGLGVETKWLSDGLQNIHEVREEVEKIRHDHQDEMRLTEWLQHFDSIREISDLLLEATFSQSTFRDPEDAETWQNKLLPLALERQEQLNRELPRLRSGVEADRDRLNTLQAELETAHQNKDTVAREYQSRRVEREAFRSQFNRSVDVFHLAPFYRSLVFQKWLLDQVEGFIQQEQQGSPLPWSHWLRELHSYLERRVQNRVGKRLVFLVGNLTDKHYYGIQDAFQTIEDCLHPYTQAYFKAIVQPQINGRMSLEKLQAVLQGQAEKLTLNNDPRLVYIDTLDLSEEGLQVVVEWANQLNDSLHEFVILVKDAKAVQNLRPRPNIWECDPPNEEAIRRSVAYELAHKPDQYQRLITDRNAFDALVRWVTYKVKTDPACYTETLLMRLAIDPAWVPVTGHRRKRPLKPRTWRSKIYDHLRSNQSRNGLPVLVHIKNAPEALRDRLSTFLPLRIFNFPGFEAQPDMPALFEHWSKEPQALIILEQTEVYPVEIQAQIAQFLKTRHESFIGVIVCGKDLPPDWAAFHLSLDLGRLS